MKRREECGSKQKLPTIMPCSQSPLEFQSSTNCYDVTAIPTAKYLLTIAKFNPCFLQWYVRIQTGFGKVKYINLNVLKAELSLLRPQVTQLFRDIFRK